jgi:peptidoglycan-associated lipoprotein
VLEVTAMAAIAEASLLVLAACASKKNQPQGPGGAGTTGLGEQGLGSKSSMQQLQQGTLGTQAGGPLTDIHFEYNDFTIRAQDGEILRTDATWMTGHPQARVQVEGHCDERGSEDYNIALGAKRAQAAKDYLVTLGVTGQRISTISYGRSCRFARNTTKAAGPATGALTSSSRSRNPRGSKVSDRVRKRIVVGCRFGCSGRACRMRHRERRGSA